MSLPYQSHHHIPRFIWLILFLPCILSCSKPSSPGAETTSVFPLESYFYQQATNFQASGVKLKKIIWSNGEEETILLEHPDWTAELLPFASSGISKPAIAAGYDSAHTGNWLIYQAKDLHPSVQRIGIRFSGEKPDSVFIIRRVSNFYYSAYDTLQFNTAGNYRISTLNSPMIGKEIRFVLQGTIISSAHQHINTSTH